MATTASDTVLSAAGPAATADSVIEVSGLRCQYGDFTAVDDIDLEVHRGEVFALLGTNGAGKTTTLEVLEGYRRRSSGQARIFGRDVWLDRRQLRPRLGIMLQETGFVGELTVTEMLSLWSKLSSRADDIDRLIERVDLSHRAKVAVGKLSGGERRRLDLALAVWGAPDLLILDEPSTGLDPESRQRTWALVRELRAAGTTIVLTTHYLDEAEALADRLAIMHAGRIAVTGSLKNVLADHPASISAEIETAIASGLPAFVGSIAFGVRTGDGHQPFRIETAELQRDLTTLMNWADQHRVPLHSLRATHASLEQIFQSVTRESATKEQG